MGKTTLVIAMLGALGALGCSGDDGGSGGSGGGAAGGAGGSGATGTGGSGATGTGGSGATGTGGSGTGGASGGAAGSGGASSVLFRDDFDAPNAAWHFDMDDPQASYAVEGGALKVTGGSVQAFAYIDKDPSWGEDFEVEIELAIETGLVGGAVVRLDPTTWNALNCNIRNDLEELRAAKHNARTYLTLSASPKTVDPGTTYRVRANIVGDALNCFDEGSITTSASAGAFTTGTLGLFVYQGTVRFLSYEVRKPG